jgi:acyl carrier protein
MQTFNNDLSTAKASPSEMLEDVFFECFNLRSDSLRDEMTMQDVELWDSLRHMELIVAIEQKFDIALSFEDISSMQDIGSIRKLVLSKLDR